GCGLLQLEANELATSEDPHNVLREVARKLTSSGIARLELPDLQMLHDHLACDLICHETCCYFSLAQFKAMLSTHGLELIDVTESAERPGMRQLTAQKLGGARQPSAAVDVALARERAAELDRPQAWADFAMLVEQGRDLLNSELEEWSYRNKR